MGEQQNASDEKVENGAGFVTIDGLIFGLTGGGMTSVLFSVLLMLQALAPVSVLRISGKLVVSRDVTGLPANGEAPAPSSLILPLTLSGSPTAPALPAGLAGRLTIRPQIDGTFRVQLPSGEYRVGALLNLPAGYTLKSIEYGGVDLLRSPLKISPNDSSELLVELALNGSPPTVSVSGRVTGIVPGQVQRIALREPTAGDLAAPLETFVSADGAFTFPEVLPGNYIVYLKLRAVTQVAVGSQDVTGVAVDYPREIFVSGHVIVDGLQTAPPTVIVESTGSAGTTQARGAGSFVVGMGNGENAIKVLNIPGEYRLKSISYGDVDLQKDPLKLDGPAVWDIIVRLESKR